jgi:hypothetical protein
MTVVVLPGYRRSRRQGLRDRLWSRSPTAGAKQVKHGSARSVDRSEKNASQRAWTFWAAGLRLLKVVRPASAEIAIRGAEGRGEQWAGLPQSWQYWARLLDSPPAMVITIQATGRVQPLSQPNPRHQCRPKRSRRQQSHCRQQSHHELCNLLALKKGRPCRQN